MRTALAVFAALWLSACQQNSGGGAAHAPGEDVARTPESSRALSAAPDCTRGAPFSDICARLAALEAALAAEVAARKGADAIQDLQLQALGNLSVCSQGTSPVCCPTGQSFCLPSVGCVDLKTSFANCGSCGHACGPNADSCAAGACQCGGGSACGAGESCLAGKCSKNHYPVVPNTAGYWYFDAVSGNMTPDSAGNGNDATLVGAPPLVAGKIGNALSFNGVDQEVDTPYVQTNVTAYTVEAWVNTASAANQVIVEDRGGVPGRGSGHSLTLGMIGANVAGGINLAFVFDTDGLICGAYSNLSVSDGQWHHVAGVFQGASGQSVNASQFSLYVDGQAITGSNLGYRDTCFGAVSAPLTGLGGTKIGRHDAWDLHFTGIIDEVRIVTAALSATQIAADAAQ